MLIVRVMALIKLVIRRLMIMDESQNCLHLRARARNLYQSWQLNPLPADISLQQA